MSLSDEIKIQVDELVRDKMLDELGHVRIVVQKTNNLLDDLKIQLSEMTERVKNLGLVLMELQEKKTEAPYMSETALEADKTTLGAGSSG